MPLFKWLPQDMRSCCWCITDLKAAVAIIIIFGIVTSPAISWALVRHSYVIRVSCHVTTSSGRTNIVDVNLNNVLSFGFGANAGLGPSCMNLESKVKNENSGAQTTNPILDVVKHMGWILLLVDTFFLICSIVLLFKLYMGIFIKALRVYMYSVAFSVGLSFIYGLLYVTLCCLIGGSFPLFEFFFTVFDLLFSLLWIYLILVIRGVIYNLEHGDPKGHLNTTPKSFFQYLYETYLYNKNALLSRIYWFTSCFSPFSRQTTNQRNREAVLTNTGPVAIGETLHRIV